MQERSDVFEAFVDGAGRRWRVARAFAGQLRRELSGWVEADAAALTSGSAARQLSRRKRRGGFFMLGKQLSSKADRKSSRLLCAHFRP